MTGAERKMTHEDTKEKRRLAVIALGGNAFLRKGEEPSMENQWRNVYNAARDIAELQALGWSILVTHGNGPQVGLILEWMDKLGPHMTLDVANAMTQGWLGYMLAQAIGNIQEELGLPRRVVALVNQVEVNTEDPDFQNPTKYVGKYYSQEDAERLAREMGWKFREDPRGGWRRVVPSPQPLGNLEAPVIKHLLQRGYTVIASGGGGVPVHRMGTRVRGVEAVIDKDRASSLLARILGADHFIILTDVEGVYLDYGKPTQRLLRRLTLREAERLLSNNVFPPGSMGPKVEAATLFVKDTGRPAAIGMLGQLLEIIKGEKGTHIVPG